MHGARLHLFAHQGREEGADDGVQLGKEPGRVHDGRGRGGFGEVRFPERGDAGDHFEVPQKAEPEPRAVNYQPRAHLPCAITERESRRARKSEVERERESGDIHWESDKEKDTCAHQRLCASLPGGLGLSWPRARAAASLRGATRTPPSLRATTLRALCPPGQPWGSPKVESERCEDFKVQLNMQAGASVPLLYY